MEPSNLPARTTFYLLWRGAPAADARKMNSLGALWDDPDFSPVRSAVANLLLDNSEEKSSQPRVTRAELDEYASLLDNSFLVGYLGDPRKKSGVVVSDGNSASPDSSASAAKTPWNGMFLIYDRTGKEAILTKAVLGLRAREKEAPEITPLSIGDFEVLKVQRKSGVTYWAQHGKFAVSANERSVLEEIIARLGATPPPTDSLAGTNAFQQAGRILGSGILEFFLRIPSPKELSPDSKAGMFQLSPLLDAVKLEDLHSMCGHVTLEGAKTRVQAAIYGNAAPGSLFDIWSDGDASPASLALASRDTISYSATQLNLLGIYEIVKRAAHSIFASSQSDTGDLLDSMATARLGQPLPQALALFTGEFSTLQTSPTLDTEKQIYFVGLHDKPGALKLLHHAFPEQISSERTEGDNTFLKISMTGTSKPAHRPAHSTGNDHATKATSEQTTFHLAVTPNSILVSSSPETLRSYLARPAFTAANGLASVNQFQTVRAQFPEKLNGQSYFDFQKLDWPALKIHWLAEARKNSAARGAHRAAKTPASTIPDWFSAVNPAVFPRHLHFTSGASWKDSTGLHYDQWIE